MFLMIDRQAAYEKVNDVAERLFGLPRVNDYRVLDAIRTRTLTVVTGSEATIIGRTSLSEIASDLFVVPSKVEASFVKLREHGFIEDGGSDIYLTDDGVDASRVLQVVIHELLKGQV
jgi:hypothetical protein